MSFCTRLSMVLALPVATFAAAPTDDRIPVDLVICLDTSGSMEQLIDSARGRVWDIVTELSEATPTPDLRVGLLTYGTPDTSSEEQGWVVRQSDLTGDLDTVYGKMMALTTEGGDEFVGWVLDDAIKTMSWSDDGQALRLIFVAGNESADQGTDRRNFRYVAEGARQRDIIINPIYAGPRDQGVKELWDQVAIHGGGDFAAIDVGAGTLQIASPFDAELKALNHELNATYIPYGEQGATGLANQLAQDANAGRMGAQSCSSRVAAKGCGLYNNASWDLVDAMQQPGFEWKTIDTSRLPKGIDEMNPLQLKNYVDGMRVVRAAVQDRITAVGAQRKAWLLVETRKHSGGQSLDQALMASLRRQAETKGFTFSTMKTVSTAPAEPQMIIPQKAPPKPISSPAQSQLAAFESRLPAVTYRVVEYEAGQLKFAQLLSARIDEPVRVMVGSQQFANERSARTQLLVAMDEQYQDMLRVRVEAPGVGISETKVPSGQMIYHVGGIEFGTVQDAQYAHEQIVAATEAFEARRKAWIKEHGQWSQHCSSAQDTTKILPVDELLDEYRAIMMTMARTAAEAFTERGC